MAQVGPDHVHRYLGEGPFCVDCGQRRAEPKQAKAKGPSQLAIGCLVIIILTVVVVGCSVVLFGGMASDVALTDEEKAESEARGWDCLSAWDGHHNGFEELVRQQLNDPSSMEPLETRTTLVQDDGRHLIYMEFTAKNAFGGRVRNTATGSFDAETCEAQLDEIYGA